MKIHPLLLALLSLASTAATQPAFLNYPLTERSWPTSLAVANFRGSAVGLLTGAGHPDVVILQDGTPTLFSSPAVQNALALISGAPTGCTAIASRHRERGPSTRWRDQLVASNGAGLWHWRLNGTVMVWEAVVSSSTWANQKQLITAEVSGDSIEDLIGIDAGGFTVRIKISNGAGYGNEYTRTFTNPVLAVSAIDWDVNSATPRALAVATLSGVHICSVGAGLGSIASVSQTGGSKATLVTARRSILLNGEPFVFEFLALTVLNGSSWVLRPIMPGVTAPPDSITLSGMDIVACVAGDMNGDGLDDLSYSQRHNHRCTVLLNRSPNNYLYSLTATDAVELALIGPTDQATQSLPAAPNNSAIQVFADLDGDGYADLVHPVESTKKVATTLNPLGDRSVRVASATIEPFTPTTALSLNLNKRTDTGVLLTPDLATHYEVAIWPLWFKSGTFKPNGSAIFTPAPVPIDFEDTQTITMNFPSASLGGDYALLVQVRALRVVNAAIEVTYKPASYMFAEHSGFQTGTVPSTPMWDTIFFYKPAHLSTQPYNLFTGGSTVGGQIPVVPPPPPNPPSTGLG